MNILRNTAAIAAVCLFSATASMAQIETPRPSPTATLSQKVGLTDVTLVYSRPSTKGRKIFGDVVENGKIWRFGANQPTKLSVADSFTVEGTKLPSGDYAVYAMPGASEWTIFLGKNAKIAAGDFDVTTAAAKFMVKPMALSKNVESFTLDLADLTTNSAYVEMQWEKTQVRFKIETNVDGKVMASIKSKMDAYDNYFAASSYYLETNRDLKQALVWADKAVQLNPAFWVYHLKAKVLAKMGNCKEAVVAANKSIELARKDKNDDYVKMNEKLIATCK